MEPYMALCLWVSEIGWPWNSVSVDKQGCKDHKEIVTLKAPDL